MAGSPIIFGGQDLLGGTGSRGNQDQLNVIEKAGSPIILGGQDLLGGTRSRGDQDQLNMIETEGIELLSGELVWQSNFRSL